MELSLGSWGRSLRFTIQLIAPEASHNGVGYKNLIIEERLNDVWGKDHCSGSVTIYALSAEDALALQAELLDGYSENIKRLLRLVDAAWQETLPMRQEKPLCDGDGCEGCPSSSGPERSTQGGGWL